MHWALKLLLLCRPCWARLTEYSMYYKLIYNKEEGERGREREKEKEIERLPPAILVMSGLNMTKRTGKGKGKAPI